LSGLPHDFNANRFVTGAPKPSADTVLAKGVNSQITVALLDGRLDLFFDNP
jgi:hypothetical protein